MLSWRLSAAALMLAPLLDIVGQLMHPASISAVDNPALHIQEVAESHVWMTSHLLFLLAFVVNLFGLWTLERLLDAEAAKPIGRLLTTVSLVGSAVAIVFITVDGFAVKLLADAWLQANATDQPAALRAAMPLICWRMRFLACGYCCTSALPRLCLGLLIASRDFPAGSPSST
jgi:hypothetical protein